VLKLHAMAQVSIALGAVTDRETLSEKIMNFIFDLFPLAERAFILLRQSERDPPVPVAARRRDGTVEDPRQARLSHTIVDEVLGRKRAILSSDTCRTAISRRRTRSSPRRSAAPCARR
jgi:hypothetical protein